MVSALANSIERKLFFKVIQIFRDEKFVFSFIQGSIQSMFLLSHDILITYGSGDNLLSLWETRKLERHPTATIQVSFDFH